MGIIDRKKREKEERRDAILAVATGLILEKGLNAISMQEIADRVELSKATLYLYFKNKLDILSEIINKSFHRYFHVVDDTVTDTDDGLLMLRKLWKSYIHLFEKSPDIFLIASIHHHIEQEENSTVIQKIDNRLERFIQKAIRRGIEDGTLDSELSPEKVSGIVKTVSLSILYNVSALPHEKRDIRKIQDTLRNTFELLLRGLAAQGTDKKLLSLSMERNSNE